MNNFLLELLVEEIPSRMQIAAISEFEKLITEGFRKCRVEYKNISSYISPRRMVVSAGLSLKVEEFIEEKRGPQISASPEIIARFLLANNSSRDDCTEREEDKKTFLFIKIKHEARDTRELLGDIIKSCIKKISWKKSMRWGNNQFCFARPLRNIMAIFNDHLLDVNLNEINLASCNYTFGHRFLAPQKVMITSVNEYFHKIKDAFVIIDANERKGIIVNEFKKLEAKKNITIEIDENLLDEVVGLVEYPVVLLGKIPEKFMKLPEEVVTTPLRVYQRYFPTRISGRLAPYFAFVANNAATDDGKTIINGNEKVLSARLADALFFFRTDLQRPLESRREDLKKIAFNDKLGSVYDRVNRISSVCNHICDLLEMEDSSLVKRASILAKCDLSTSMVYEFPELQGVIGAYYAQIQGEEHDVCSAIREQYRPAHEITNRVSALFSLADKIEIIAVFFFLGKEPTGSKDPFALRRAAIGILKIIEKFLLDFDLKSVIQKTLLLLPGTKDFRIDTADRIYDFILERLKVVLKELGIRQNIIGATVTNGDSILTIFAKAKILNGFLQEGTGEKLLSIYKRIKNIILSNGNTLVDEKLFREKEEMILWHEIKKLEEKFLKIEEDSGNFVEKFTKQLYACAEMEQVASTFFDKILIHSEEDLLRQNRLNLLTKVFFIFAKVIPIGLWFSGM